jgi:hypothetical protein
MCTASSMACFRKRYISSLTCAQNGDGNYGERRLARAVRCLGLPLTTAIRPRPCTYGSELAGARLRGVRRWVRRHPREP